MPNRVIVWNEARHERLNPKVSAIYPHGMHNAIADALRRSGDLIVTTATLDDDEEHGLSQPNLDSADVLIWWGHMAHDAVRDDVVERVCRRVWAGMGLIVLHSGHFSKIFKRLMGTSCDLKWREADDREILWITRPGHPIAAGLDDHFILPAEEMYGEFFDIPEPLETILISSFSGGEVFRSGVTFQRGAGRIFYFRPGHETYPTYHDANVQRVIANAVRWAAPLQSIRGVEFGQREKGWIDRV